MQFVDARFDEGLLDKTLTELKITSIEDDGTSSSATGTLRDQIQHNTNAITSVETNTAYLLPGFYAKTAEDQNATKVHEQLHGFLRANHVMILRFFGIPPTPPQVWNFTGVPETRNPITGKIIIAGIPASTIVIPSERTSADTLQSWLLNNCE